MSIPVKSLEPPQAFRVDGVRGVVMDHTKRGTHVLLMIPPSDWTPYPSIWPGNVQVEKQEVEDFPKRVREAFQRTVDFNS